MKVKAVRTAISLGDDATGRLIGRRQVIGRKRHA
jgi:hypothetical protein